MTCNDYCDQQQTKQQSLILTNNRINKTTKTQSLSELFCCCGKQNCEQQEQTTRNKQR